MKIPPPSLASHEKNYHFLTKKIYEFNIFYSHSLFISPTLIHIFLGYNRDQRIQPTQVVLVPSRNQILIEPCCLNNLHSFVLYCLPVNGFFCNILHLFIFIFHSFPQNLQTLFVSKCSLSKTHFTQGIFFNFWRLLYSLRCRKTVNPIKGQIILLTGSYFLVIIFLMITK